MSVNNPNFVAISELNSGLATKVSYEPFSSGLPSAGAVAATLPRTTPFANLPASLVSGREQVILIWLDAGTVITSISFWSGSTAAVTPTNQWFSIRDVNRNLKAITVDGTTGGWNAVVEKTLNLTAPFTVPTSGFFYLGCMVAAATPPTLLGVAYAAGTAVSGKPPIVTGFDGTNTGLTTPATAPAVSAAYTVAALLPYVTLQ